MTYKANKLGQIDLVFLVYLIKVHQQICACRIYKSSYVKR